MATAQTIITDAHVHLGVLPAGSTLGTDLSTLGLATLNRMIEAWTAAQIPLAGQTLQTIAMTGAANYAVSPRPVKIEAASVIDAAGIEQFAQPVSSAQWAAIPDKSRTGAFAEAIWYDGGYPTGNVYLTPKPGAGTLNLRVIALITAFPTLATAFAMAPGVEQAVVYNLAVELAASLGKPVPAPVATLAATSKDALIRLAGDSLGIPATQAVPHGGK